MMRIRPDIKKYDEFNDQLTNQMNPQSAFKQSVVPTIAKSTPESLPASQSEKMGIGTLQAQVTLANGAIPMAGAKVSVFQSGQETNPIAELFTDKSGKTEKLELAAPAVEYSQSRTGIKPYSNYNMKVELPGFYTQHFVDVPVFDQINSIQPVELLPLAEGQTTGDSPAVIETEPDL